MGDDDTNIDAAKHKKLVLDGMSTLILPTQCTETPNFGECPDQIQKFGSLKNLNTRGSITEIGKSPDSSTLNMINSNPYKNNSNLHPFYSNTVTKGGLVEF